MFLKQKILKHLLTDIYLLFTILFFPLCHNAYSSQVTLVWEPPKKEDGSPYKEIVGYKLYYGLSSGEYTDVILLDDVTTTYTFNNLTFDRYYFAVTAYNKYGYESKFSE